MQKVLIVDDDRSVADTVSLIFRKHGFDVRTMYTASEALECGLEWGPELLLCDIDMPIRDGLELMGDFGDELPECPILVLTGFYHALGRVRDRSRSLPQAVSIMTKPCQPADLLREARAMLGDPEGLRRSA